MKKKQAQPLQDPKELNAAFLLKFAKLNYEAKNINVQMLNAFSNLLQYLSESITREPQNFTQQIIKALIDVAITVEFNLHMTEDFLSGEIEPVLKFLETLFNFVDKVFTYEQKPNKDKAVQVIDIFWPLLRNQKEIEKVEVKHFDKIALVLQKLPNLPYIFEIEPHPLRINPQAVLNQAIQISFLNEKIDFSVIFRAALSKYNEKNKIFIESFLSFFESVMNDTSSSKENRAIFQKCLNVLMNISNSIGEKYNYVQIFFNRVIKSSNFIRNFVYALSSRLNNGSSQSDMRIEKYYSNDHLLSLSFIILQKIVTFRYMTKDMSEALEIVSKFSQHWIDLDEHTLNTNDFSNKINSDFMLKIIKFLMIDNKGLNPQAQQISSLSQIFQNPLSVQSQRSLFEEELDQKRLYEFIKQVNKIRTESQEGEEDMMMESSSSGNKPQTIKKEDNGSNKIAQQVSIVKNFSRIFENLSKNKFIAQKLKFKSLEKVEDLLVHSFENEVDGRTQQATIIKEVSEMMIKCLPCLIPDEWMEQLLKRFLFQDKVNGSIKNEKGLEIVRVIIIKKLEAENFSKLKHDLQLEKFMNVTFGSENLDKQNVLNFHFLVFYIYMKKCSSLPEKEEITQIQSLALNVLSKLTWLIEMHSQLNDNRQSSTLKKLNKKLLILQFLLILILDHPSGSFKLSLKKLFSNDVFKVGKMLDLSELLIINQKQTASNFFNSKLKQILNSEQRCEGSLCAKFLSFVQQLNIISFPQNYLHIGTQSKEEKNFKIFLNIKMNGIALLLNRSHSVPTLIQNINTMRRVNSISEFEILLYSFGQYFDEVEEKNNTIALQTTGNQKNSSESVEDSVFIVAFNYLLKINIESDRFNEKKVEEGQNDLRQQIKTLKVLHIQIQSVLQKTKQLILLQNPPFSLKTLIKLLKNLKESINQSGIAQKYADMINEGQIIRLISELTEDSQKLKMEFTQLGLMTTRKLLLKDQKIRERIDELQKVKLEQVGQKSIENQNPLEEQIIEEEHSINTVTELSPKLKQLYLMYYPFKHDLSLFNLLKVRIESAILQLLEDPQQTLSVTQASLQLLQKSIVEDLFKNISQLKEIIIKESEDLSPQAKLQLLWNFDYQNNNKFITFIIKSILKMFSANMSAHSSLQLNDKIFAISAQLLDNQEICRLAQKEIGQDLNLELVSMISQRVNQGIAIVRKSLEAISPIKKSKKQISQTDEQQNKQIKDFLISSLKLYNVLKKVINFESVNSQEIINCVLEKDELNSIEITRFIIQELLNLSTSFIKTKSESITGIIFDYIIKINEFYQSGKQKLQIPEFLCEFFNISHTDKSNNWMKNLEKSQRSTSVCTPNPLYRCMKCDDKRLICYSCMMECHKGHPVLYLSEQKFPKCQCRQTGGEDCCKLARKDENKDLKNPSINNIFSYERRQPIKHARHQFFMGGDDDRIYEPLGMYDEEQFNEINRFGGARIRKPKQFESLGRDNVFAIDPSYDRVDRIERIERIERFQQMERVDNPFGAPQLLRQQKRVEQSNKASEENFDFEDQVYNSAGDLMQVQNSSSSVSQSEIVSQSYLLPVFLQMFNEIYSGSEEVSTQKINYQTQKFGFDSLMIGKVLHASWRATNGGTYNVRLRKDNPLNNKSPAVSKQIIAQNQKFIVIASGNMLYAHLKQKYFQQLYEAKPNQVFQSVHQFTGNFDIHSIDFSPLDEFSFVVAGLHNIILMQITGDGLISRNNSQNLRVNVNNDYINKVRTSALGVFYSTSYQIKLLNWSFKQVLTIKSTAECLLKEWCVYEKRIGCTIYCVTAQGYTEFIDVNPSDEGKSFFTHKVNDGRKKIETGASILVKDVDKIGKVYLGSFKDSQGTNLIASLVGDSTENASLFTLKNNYVDILGKKFLIGQAQILKGGQNEIYIVCTIRESLTPDISIQQGQLVVFKVRKDRKCEFNLINTDNKCEHFCVIPVGDSNWSIISMHDDGSLHFAVLQKPLKSVIDQQCKRLKEIQPVSTDQNKEKHSQLKQSIKKQISAESLQNSELQPLNHFREFSDLLKTSNDIKVVKKQNDYEVSLSNSSKVITGFTLPFVGNVYLPHRTVKSTVQIGLSNLEILHYFAEGTLKFKVQKLQDYKSGMDNLNQRFKQKLERLQKLNEIAMDSERANQLINTIKQAEALHDEVDFYGLTMDSFKNRIMNFDEIFNEESTSESKDKKVQKMGILLKIFIEHSIKEQNYLCEPEEILEFVKNLRKISLTISKNETYKIVRDLIVSALKMYENMNQIKSHVFNDEYYPLKFATEEKVHIYYEMLKGQIADSQVQEIINAFCDICEQDLALGLLYLSKYPSLLPKIQKKNKKIDKIDNSIMKLLKLYVIGYQVLKYKNHNCEWILSAICSIFGAQQKSKPLRQSFYETLSKYANVKLEAWLKNVAQVDGQQNVSDVNIISKPAPARQQNPGSENNMASLYNQFSMGQMDEQAMLKMAQEISLMQFKQKQEDHYNFGGNGNNNNNASDRIEEEKQNEDDMLMMEDHEGVFGHGEHKKTGFLIDLVDHCTSKLNEPSELAMAKIIVLYVLSKYVNSTEDVNVFCQILNRIVNILGDLTTNCDNYDKHILMAYFSVFSNILTTSNIIRKKSSEQAEQLCLVIKEQVMDRLECVKPQKVQKLKSPPNLLGKIFRGEKLYTFAHYAYGLVSLLLPPCEPTPILLSLECYWLLPESKQHYTKMKHMTTIKQGIDTGNIEKIYQVATQYPDIWRESSNVEWLESWILSKKPNWEKALSLQALYYEEEKINTVKL